MKTIKNLIIGALMIFAASKAFSQNVSIGLRTGASYYNVNNEEIDDKAKYTLGLDVAVPVEIQLTKVVSIQPELHFIQKGVQFENNEGGQETTFAVKTNYVEVPVLLKANYGSEKFKCYAFVAPSVGYATNRYSVEQTGDLDKVKEKVDFIDADDAKSQRWDLGATGGIGGSVKAGIGSVVIDARYSFGLNDNTKFANDKPDGWEKSTNRGCTLSVGYTIPLGKN